MLNDPILAVRSFYRTLTLRVGVFSDSFLGRGRPLAQARLLFEIGKTGADVRDLRSWMDLDSGYLSRLLRSVERDGLVEVTARESDLRSRTARLTAVGRRELSELNKLGDRFAAETLEPLNKDEQARLVTAMAEVEKLLNLSFTRISAEDPDSVDAQWCLQQYFAELRERFDHSFDASKSIPADVDELRAPRGAFLVARLDGRLVGCGAVKLVEPGVASVKRMWVSRSMRGVGVGRRILLALEAEAASLDVKTLRLETNKNLHEAQALYRRNGYREVPAFNSEPYANHWFEKRVGAVT